MKGSFSILFYPKGAKTDKQGKALIFARITVDGKRSEVSIKRRIHPSRWDSSAGKAIGRSHEESELNRYIASIRSEIYKIHEKIVTKRKLFTSLMI